MEGQEQISAVALTAAPAGEQLPRRRQGQANTKVSFFDGEPWCNNKMHRFRGATHFGTPALRTEQLLEAHLQSNEHGRAMKLLCTKKKKQIG